MRWTGSGKLTWVNVTGGTDHTGGVGVLLSQDAAKALIAWNPVNERIITVLETKFTKVPIVGYRCTHRPTQQMTV